MEIMEIPPPRLEDEQPPPPPQSPPTPPIDLHLSLQLSQSLPQSPHVPEQRQPRPPQLQPEQPQLQLYLQPVLEQPPPQPQLQLIRELDLDQPLSQLPHSDQPEQPQLQLFLEPVEPQLPQSQPEQPQLPLQIQPAVGRPPLQRRNRRNRAHAPPPEQFPIIRPPYPWATDRRAQVHTLQSLMEKGITTVSGDVQCKRCEKRYQIEYNLKQNFWEITRYVAENKYSLRERAPPQWLNPTLPKCRHCNQENSVKPKMSEKKKCINWLFLLLGRLVGCCTLDQLKYFCKHTGNHRTGAKDRLLFLTYLELCRQVFPEGPFNRD